MAWLLADDELGGLHRHCYRCFSLKRCNGDADACPVEECPLGCGTSYHMCKSTEHEELCPNMWVSCLNASFGCECELPRRDRTKHLQRCPASVVACSAEWNRWPVYCKLKLKNVPFRQKNPRASEGQLDFDLASRDQRMVPELGQIPRRTRLALRNNLTRRHPALPAPSNIRRKSSVHDTTMQSLRLQQEFEDPESLQVGDTLTGVAKKFSKTQKTIWKRWQEDVDRAIARTGMPVPKKYWEYEELEKGNIHKHCAYCMLRNCDRQEKFYEMEEGWRDCCKVVDCLWGCGARYHNCKSTEHKMICSHYEEEGEFDWICRDRMVKKLKKVVDTKPLKLVEDLLAGGLSESVSKLGTRKGKVFVPNPPALPSKNLYDNMRFDIGVETVTRLQQKPRAMYTFLCGQNLRRDEYEWHVKNVHNDIHGGLNNWIEARCPLASHGCGFSVRRLYPGIDPGNCVRYSKEMESFGVKPSEPKLKTGSGVKKKGSKAVYQVCLADLPVEVLQEVFGYLDPWTLGTVALVSRYLREVACGLLDSKGCLSLQWERVEEDDKIRWEVAYKRWFYSCAFDPVKQWGINVDGKISNHLQSCPFNLRTKHCAMPKRDPLVKSFMQSLEQKLRQKRESEWFIS